MSTPQPTASPSRQPNRALPKRDSHTPSDSAAKQTPKRVRNNRHRRNGTPNQPRDTSAPNASDSAAVDTDSALLSGEEIPFKGRQNVERRKHTQSQGASDRRCSPPHLPAANLTDTERAPNKTATTPARATPAKSTAAYAGASFNASPAASALPIPNIPKFLSKSVPAKVRGNHANILEESSPSASPPSPSPPTPSRASIPTARTEENSSGNDALNMLFARHREEKARTFTSRAVVFTGPPHPEHVQPPMQPSKHDSSTSLSAMFPIELDAEGHRSPPPGPLFNARSVTAPSRIPQAGVAQNAGVHPEQRNHTRDYAAAQQELLSKLNQVTQNPTTATPPRHFNHTPSEPGSRNEISPFYSPSAARPASGPSTPVHPSQGPPSDFHYGNTNLSPLFQAARNDNKRNSTLRTEITPDSPIRPHAGGLPAIAPAPQPNASSPAQPSQSTHQLIHNQPRHPNHHKYRPGDGHYPIGPPAGPRNDSNSPVPPYRGNATNTKMRGQGRRAYNSRPNSNPNYKEPTAVTLPKPPVANSFIPSSVQAKRFSTPTKPKPEFSVAEAKPTYAETDFLEQRLKNMLNLNTTDVAGVR